MYQNDSVIELSAQLGQETIHQAYQDNAYGKKLIDHLGSVMKIMRFSSVRDRYVCPRLAIKIAILPQYRGNILKDIPYNHIQTSSLPSLPNNYCLHIAAILLFYIFSLGQALQYT